MKSGLQSGQRLFDLYLFALWFLYIFLSPNYIFHEGLPQPAAIALMLGVLPWAGFSLINNRTRIPLAYMACALFAGLTFFVNWINFAFIPDMRFVLSSLYYPFNALIFFFSVSLFKRDYALAVRVTYVAIVMGIMMQGLWAEFLPDPGARRMTAGFKNPNQLAYWTLLSMAMLLFLKRDGKFNFLDFGILLVGAYIQTLALSKAGIIASAILMMLVFFMPQMPRAGKYLGSAFILIAGVYVLLSPQTLSHFGNKIEALNRVSERMDNVGEESDDSLEGRGYLRITENPVYLVIGAGEGGFERFRTWGSPKELHSGLATILFSYGVLGFCFFGAFVMCIYYKQPWYCWGILFCVLLFSLSSQTIRFNHTWIFFAVSYGTFLYGRRPVVKNIDMPQEQIISPMQAPST